MQALDVVIALAEITRGVNIIQEEEAGRPVALVVQQVGVSTPQALALPFLQQGQLGVQPRSPPRTGGETRDRFPDRAAAVLH
jgi:hypothetical protein